MSLRLTVYGKVKCYHTEPKRKRVLIERIKSYAVDPKLSDLPMSRLKLE